MSSSQIHRSRLLNFVDITVQDVCYNERERDDKNNEIVVISIKVEIKTANNETAGIDKGNNLDFQRSGQLLYRETY